MKTDNILVDDLDDASSVEKAKSSGEPSSPQTNYGARVTESQSRSIVGSLKQLSGVNGETADSTVKSIVAKSESSEQL